jgi:hypothetical protein
LKLTYGKADVSAVRAALGIEAAGVLDHLAGR